MTQTDLPFGYYRNVKVIRRLRGQLQRIRTLREIELGELADQIGSTTPTELHAWERGMTSPTLAQLARWAGALGFHLRIDLRPGPTARYDWTPDRRICRYCGDAISSSATREHLTPTSRGGSKTGDNVGWSCRSCNGEKGCLTDEEFIVLRGFPAVRKSVETTIGKYLNMLAVARAEKANGLKGVQPPKVPTSGGWGTYD